MTTQVLFVQGGGDGAHACDQRLVSSLEGDLGGGYAIRYPRMPNESDPNYLAWRGRLCEELDTLGDDAVLVAHSIGASMLIRLLAEHGAAQATAGIFLIAPPYLHEREGWQWKEAELPADAARQLPKTAPLFFYHGREDEVVPFAHLELYAKTFQQARIRALDGRDHQLNDDLTEVANDIRSIRG